MFVLDTWNNNFVHAAETMADAHEWAVKEETKWGDGSRYRVLTMEQSIEFCA